MYIKVYESRQSNKSYLLRHGIHPKEIGMPASLYIENEDHTMIMVDENELFQIVDKFYKEKLSEKVKAHEQKAG